MTSIQEEALSAPSPRPSKDFTNVAIVIPTFNASRYMGGISDALRKQGLQSHQVLIVDSSSTDDTRDLAEGAGYRLVQIPKRSFRHGATRQMAGEVMQFADFLVYMTQDAQLHEPRAIENLLRAFEDPDVGAAYGRQLPRPDADPIERHGRMFSYTDRSEIRSLGSREQLGFRAAFFSDSFAAFRRTALEDVGGFPKNAIVSEEVTVAARMLLLGWNIAYQADAAVVHSHRLTVLAEFSRYFDIGVHHSRESWLIDQFGGPGGEGRKFVLSQMRYLAETAPSYLPMAALRTCTKLCGYQLGAHERYLPGFVKRVLSAQPNFWSDDKGFSSSWKQSSATRQPRGSAPSSHPIEDSHGAQAHAPLSS